MANSMETDDPHSGWLVRNPLGQGVAQDPREKSAARLQAMVNLAWMQAHAVVGKRTTVQGLDNGAIHASLNQEPHLLIERTTYERTNFEEYRT